MSDGAIAATSLEKYIPQVKSQHHIVTKEVQKQEKIEHIETHNQHFINEDIRTQLQPIFNKLTKDIYLVGVGSSDSFSQELKSFIEEFSSLHERIHGEWNDNADESPHIMLYNHQKNPLGVNYHCVPGGHEFNSFVLAVYNAGSEGQVLENDILKKIHDLQSHHFQVFISLSCTMCPDVVQASQRIALENHQVQTDIYDLAHHPHYKEQYNIMSVPCMVIDGQRVVFGKKNLEDILEIIETA